MTGGRTWRDRLAEAIERSGKSYRRISLDAGLGATYVYDVLEIGKEPTVDRLLKVIEQIGGGSIYILHGIKISPEEEEVLKTYSRLNESQRQTFLQFLRDNQPRRS